MNEMNELIFIVEEAPEGGFTARALGASIFTEADDCSELQSQVRDAVLCHFDEGLGPKVIRLHYVREDVTNLEIRLTPARGGTYLVDACYSSMDPRDALHLRSPWRLRRHDVDCIMRDLSLECVFPNRVPVSVPRSYTRNR